VVGKLRIIQTPRQYDWQKSLRYLDFVECRCFADVPCDRMLINFEQDKFMQEAVKECQNALKQPEKS
jgi:hypothetical protein